MGVTRLAMAQEEWEVDDSWNLRHGPIREQPNRIEIICLAAMDSERTIIATRRIVRPPHGKPYLDKLDKPVDLVINTGSMQEMTDEWIDFYIDWLARFDTRYFYSLNYVAQPLSIMGESRHLWTQRLGPNWATRHMRLNIPLLDLEGPSRDFLEVLFEKTSATQSLKDWSVYRGRLL